VGLPWIASLVRNATRSWASEGGAMTSLDGWRPEQLVEHDGILLRRGIPSRSTYVVKSSMNPSICVLACRVWQRN
jgi:hypothetical protein